MSRFGDYDDGPDYPNAGDLWWNSIRLALSGKRGQRALAELEQALIDLPQPRLVRGHLAANGEVCAVGALVTRRRVANGEKLDAILADLEGRIPPECECGHPKSAHDEDGHCTWRSFNSERGCWDDCQSFRISEYQSECDGADETARAGVEIGLTYALAWRLAYLNDEDGRDDETPEQRYERVLAWVRSAQVGRSAEVVA